MLMRNLEKLARDKGLSRLQLLADRDNAEALDFYTDRDWKRTRLICLRRQGKAAINE